ERVERGGEQARTPAIEQIAGDDEMIGAAGRDAIELVLERTHVGGVADMRVREMGDARQRLASPPPARPPFSMVDASDVPWFSISPCGRFELPAPADVPSPHSEIRSPSAFS